MPTDFIPELRWRGLVHQVTDEPGLSQHLAAAPRHAYVGFDPTADSLTIGNLVPIMMLVHLQRAGHTPVVVMGGGTGLIGDPSGKSAERQLMTRDRVEANVERQQRIFSGLLDFSPRLSNRALVLNNLDWLGSLTFLDALRDIGKHFSVNMMIQKESVRERLHARDQGISYTEFSYMILQAYDFLHLFRHHAVTVQMGGSDQFGNIVAGIDLIRRATAPALQHPHAPDHHAASAAFGLTAPLVTKADGGKFGKTESGAVWLSAPGTAPDSRGTSPYAYYQFWLNAADADVIRFLKLFTLLPREQIDALEAAHAADPSRREAHRTLAREATRLLHGPTELAHAEAAAHALFSGDIASLPESTLNEVFASAPSSRHPRSMLDAPGADPVELLAQTSLVKSNREAREFLHSGAVTINARRLSPQDRVTTDWLLHGKVLAVRRGKKSWHVMRFD